MDTNKLQIAIYEAERFIQTANLAKSRHNRDWVRDKVRYGLKIRYRYTNASPENAACKRASMDLTRALAQLRK